MINLGTVVATNGTLRLANTASLILNVATTIDAAVSGAGGWQPSMHSDCPLHARYAADAV